jgi:hypothetical protein
VDRRILAAARALVLGVAAFGAGCGDDDAEPPAATGPASPPPPPPPGGDPRLTPSPRLEEIARTEVPGFERRGERATAAAATPWYEAVAETSPGWRVVAVVTFGPCDPCKPLDVATWQRHEADLRGVLPAEHRADPALVFDLFEVDLEGRRGIALYKRSLLAARGDGVTDAASVVHGLTAWWNDGRDEVSIDLTVRGPKDAPARTTADLDARASRFDLVRAAQEVFAAFAPAFRR